MDIQKYLSKEPVGHTKRQNGRWMKTDITTNTVPTVNISHDALPTMKAVKIS